jgi:hypothetical protein
MLAGSRLQLVGLDDFGLELDARLMNQAMASA